MNFKDSFTLNGKIGDYEECAVARSNQREPHIFLRPGTKTAKLIYFSALNMQSGKFLERDPIKYLRAFLQYPSNKRILFSPTQPGRGIDSYLLPAFVT
jgi:hypothetical protein